MVDTVSLVIECSGLVCFQPNALDDAVFRVPLVVGVCIVVTDICGLDEADLTLKSSAEVFVDSIEVESVSGALEFEIAGGSGGVGGRVSAVDGTARRAFDELAEGGPFVV